MGVVIYVIRNSRHFEWQEWLLRAQSDWRWERVTAQSVARIDITKAVG